jgi:hypothetical protein
LRVFTKPFTFSIGLGPKEGTGVHFTDVLVVLVGHKAKEIYFLSGGSRKI